MKYSTWWIRASRMYRWNGFSFKFLFILNSDGTITTTMAKECILLSVYGKSRVSKREWKIFGGILFRQFDSWRFKFPDFLFFMVVTYKLLARTQNPFSGGKKQHQTTFKFQGMFISKLFYNLIDSLRSKTKIRISHTILKILLLILPPTLTLDCLWCFKNYSIRNARITIEIHADFVFDCQNFSSSV